MNLLPDDWLRRLLIRRRVRCWIVVCLLVSFACLAVSTTIFATQAKQRTHCYNVRKAARPVQEVTRQVRQLHARLAVLEGRESLLATLESASHPFQMLGIVNESAETDMGQVVVTSFTVSTKSSTTSSNATQSGRNAARSTQGATSEEVELTVTGTASDDFAITQFVSKLREFNVFDQVVLHSSESRSNQSDRTFRVGCTFEK